MTRDSTLCFCKPVKEHSDRTGGVAFSKIFFAYSSAHPLFDSDQFATARSALHDPTDEHVFNAAEPKMMHALIGKIWKENYLPGD